MNPYLIYTQRANKKGKKYKYGKIKITQITHNWGLNLSLISYKSPFKLYQISTLLDKEKNKNLAY